MTETTFCACCYNVATHLNYDGTPRCDLHRPVDLADAASITALRAENSSLKARIAAIESELSAMAEKLDDGIECYPSSPCDIFATLLSLHGLWRGKPTKTENKPC